MAPSSSKRRSSIGIIFTRLLLGLVSLATISPYFLHGNALNALNHVTLQGQDDLHKLLAMHNATYFSGYKHTSTKNNNHQPNVIVNVFYHTYAGPTEAHRNVTRTIVQQQMRYVVQAVAQSPDHYQWILRYVSVGNATVLSQKWMQSLCRPPQNPTNDSLAFPTDKLTCIHLKHLDEGHEEWTLQHLHDHCRAINDISTNEKQHLVVYLHSKGAFLHLDFPTIQKHNEMWMPSLTQAPIHEACLASLLEPYDDREPANPHETTSHTTTNQSTCNCCGLQFYPLWTNFFPGNMFSAHCSYVQTLLPISAFAKQLQHITDEVRSQASTRWTFQGYQKQPDHYGSGRYSNEHWIASSPLAKPCDMTPSWYTGLFLHMPSENQTDVFANAHNLVQPAPRVPLMEGKWYRFRRPKTRGLARQAAKINHTRPHEYFLLPGLLYKAYKLYNQTPPDDSWIWSYYPHGTVWRDRLNHATHNRTALIAQVDEIW